MAVRGASGGGRNAPPAQPTRRTAALARRLALAAGVLLAAGPVRAQSLGDASASALENSFALRADRARQDGVEARLRGAVDAFLPSVAFTADVPLSSRIGYFPQAASTRVGFDGPDEIPRRNPTVWPDAGRPRRQTRARSGRVPPGTSGASGRTGYPMPVSRRVEWCGSPCLFMLCSFAAAAVTRTCSA